MTRIGMGLALLALIGTTISCDRVTKHFAAVALAGTPTRSFLSDTVRLQYAENTGGFLGLGANLPPTVRAPVFTIGTGLTLVVTVIVAIRFRVSGWPLIGLGLAVAGGASNLADRVIRGSVIDFMNVGVGPLRTGIFNVADMAVLLGVVTILLTQHRPDRHRST